MPPTLYIKNLLKSAEDGLGDGTAYATATGATVNQTNKTFALAGLTIITDLGADADDKFNGYLLYFTTTGNKYHIVDWVAATDTATVYEIPDAADTGACTIRRALTCEKTLATNPAFFMADGFRSLLWKSIGADADPIIEACLPNLLSNGGFETNSLAPWSKVTTGGTSDGSAVNPTSPILGKYDYKINIGDRTSVSIQQAMTLLKKGSYRLMFKARFSGTYVADKVVLRFFQSGAGTLTNMTLSNPSSGTMDQTASSWKPVIGAANAWHSLDIDTTSDLVQLTLDINLSSASFDLYLDEVYLFERINVAALIAANYAHPDQTYQRIVVNARYCSRLRTGAGAPETFQIFDETMRGAEDPHLKEFTATIAPVWTIEHVTGQTELRQAGEILLAEKWAWGRGVAIPFDPNSASVNEKVNVAMSGARTVYKYHQRRTIKGKAPIVMDADLAIWKNNYKPSHFDVKYPFALKLDSASDLMLVQDIKKEFGTPYNDKRPDLDFEWEEVL